MIAHDLNNIPCLGPQNKLYLHILSDPRDLNNIYPLYLCTLKIEKKSSNSVSFHKFGQTSASEQCFFS